MKRVLIIAGGLQRGGAERVAANISKYADRDHFQFDYLVFEGIENVYGEEIERMGGSVITVKSPSCGYGAYLRTLVSLMRKNNYCAVHSHTMFNSGLNLLAALFCGIKCRIAHSHTTKTETKVSIPQKIYEQLMRMIILLCSTRLFACGEEAGFWLFGKRAFRKKGIVIKNGIDVDAFAYSSECRARIRRAYDIENAFVIGHSGTLLPLKNQLFLIKRMPEILRQCPNAVLLLIGGGEAEYTRELKQMAIENGVADKVFFCGAVDNVCEYLSALDVFAFPSLREGTPLALIEAQSNGLPCIVSDCVPADAKLTQLVKSLPLTEPQAWVHALCAASREKPEMYTYLVRESGYSAQEAYKPIYEAYLGE